MKNQNKLYNKKLNELKKILFINELINTNIFKRLKNISFLGSYEYFDFENINNKITIKKNISNNRYIHSINVAILMNHFLKYSNFKFTEEEKKILLTAALLHDIGHFPFSHSSEDIFRNEFNLNHHQNTIDIIKNNKELQGIFKKYNINHNEVIFILEKDKNKEENIKYYLLNSPFNIDAIEGTFRTYRSKYGNKNLTFNEFDVIKGILNKDLEILDKFWKLKNIAYKNIINEKKFKIIDNITIKVLKNKNIILSDKNLNDKEIDKKYNILIEIKEELSNIKNIKYKIRNVKYEINHAIKDIDIYNISDLYERYKVRKSKKEVLLKLDN